MKNNRNLKIVLGKALLLIIIKVNLQFHSGSSPFKPSVLLFWQGSRSLLHSANIDDPRYFHTESQYHINQKTSPLESFRAIYRNKGRDKLNRKIVAHYIGKSPRVAKIWLLIFRFRSSAGLEYIVSGLPQAMHWQSSILWDFCDMLI